MILFYSFNNNELNLNEEFKKYYSMIYNGAFRLAYDKNDAEDIAQDTFLIGYKKYSNFKKESSLSTWLYGILINVARNYNKKVIKTRDNIHNHAQDDNILESIGDCENFNTENIAINNDLKSIILKEIDNLDDNHRDVIILKDIQDLSYKEIAEILDIELGTVKSRLSRAREKLIIQLHKKGINKEEESGL